MGLFGGQELVQGSQTLLEKVGSGCRRPSLSLQPQKCGDEHRRSLAQIPTPPPPTQMSDHPSEPVSPSIFVGESTQLREDSLIIRLSMEPAQGAPGGIAATHQNPQSQ